MLDAHQLNVFLTAARLLNFTAAARQLHMTQPSVSQHIQALEQHFDTKLFVRSGRHLRLSDAGEELLPMAQEMVSISQSIDNKMKSLQGDVYGRLTVGCSTTVGKYVLPLLLAGFMQKFPKVETSCYVTPRKIAMQMLADGDVHVALASGRVLSHELEFSRFITDRVSLIAPLNHPWARREYIEPEELLDANFIWREEGSGTRCVAEEKLRQHGIIFEQFKTILTLGNSEAIALAVQEGIGVGFVSQIIISRLVEGTVAPVKVRGLNIEQEIYIGRDANRLGTPAQTAFWKFVTDPHNPVLNRLIDSSKAYENGYSFNAVSLNGYA